MCNTSYTSEATEAIRYCGAAVAIGYLLNGVSWWDVKLNVGQECDSKILEEYHRNLYNRWNSIIQCRRDTMGGILKEKRNWCHSRHHSDYLFNNQLSISNKNHSYQQSLSILSHPQSYDVMISS